MRWLCVRVGKPPTHVVACFSDSDRAQLRRTLSDRRRMTNAGYQDIQQIIEDRSRWARRSFEQLADCHPRETAAMVRSEIAERLAQSPAGISPLDDMARKLGLAECEVDLLWLLAVCECDRALAAIMRQGQNQHRPAVPATVAMQLLRVARTDGAVVEKSTIRRMYADGLLEGTEDFRVRLASRMLLLVQRGRFPRATTQPTTAEAPDAADAAWVASLQRTAANVNNAELPQGAVLCVGISRVG